jgi:DNA-binding winged helix-turn-helix (wHTH) protein
MRVMAFPPFAVDLDEERLWRNGVQIPLRRKPFAILGYLLAHPQRIVTHEELLASVWGGAVVSESAIRSHLHELRQALGEGVIETVIGRGYRFTAAPVEASLAPAAGPSAPAAAREPDHSVVGRDAELAVLRAALARARSGERQLCFVTGDPGIGKTTLVQTFLDELAADAGVLAARGQCVEQYGSPEAYLAVIELVVRLRRSRDGDRVLAALVRHAPAFLAQVPHLVPEDAYADVMARAKGGAEGRVVRELVEVFDVLAAAAPLVVVLEDLQWSDLATIDFVSALQQRRERARLVVIATSRRAEAHTPSHPLYRVVRGLVARGAATSIALDRIAAGDLHRLVDARFPGHRLPAWFAEVVDGITGGVPLFVVSLLDDVARRRMVVERDGTWEVTVTADELRAHRPESVRQLIDIGLDRLTLDEQRVLECAAVVGLEFPPVLVAAALDRPVEDVDELCDGLVRRGLFLRRAGVGEWPDGSETVRYAVTHGLVHEVCLARSAAARVQRWHHVIAETLESAHGERAPEFAHVLASHFDQSRDLARAVHYYRLAGDQNAQRFASPDAMRMYQRAHELVVRLPAGADRDRIELDLLGGLTQATIRASRDATREPLAMFARMAELAEARADFPRLAQALASLSFRHSILAEYRRANEVSDRLDQLAQTYTFPPPLVAFSTIARLLATIWHSDAETSRAQLQELTGTGGTALGATDRRVVLLLYQSVMSWLVGRPRQAFADIDAAIEQARALGDPYAAGAAFCNLSRARVWCGAPPADVRAAAEVVLAIPDAAVWHNQCRINVAWADCAGGPLDGARCTALVEEFHDRSERFPMGITVIGHTLARVLRASRREADALVLVDHMLAFGRDRGEVLFVPEYLRLRGELLAAGGDVEAAAAMYMEAVAAAQPLSLHALALRAAVALGNRSLVAGCLAHFEPDADTADVAAARALVGAAP